ncbi:MAG: DUF6338 family protein [Caldilineaceae bacterium]|nr:DUF6338 family protein [Caldilineaceae bacterium]
MSDYLSLSDIASALAYFVPGFIALSVRSQFMTGITHTQNSERFLTYATISVIYDSLIFRFVNPAWITNSTLIFLSVFIVGPAAIGVLLGINIQKNLIRGFLSRFGVFTTHALPTAWDWKFGSSVKEQWVLITLRSGVTFGGLYGSDSFASSSPGERDLYIQWIYDIDEEGKWSSPGKKGVLVAANEISTIEFWPYSASGEN